MNCLTMFTGRTDKQGIARDEACTHVHLQADTIHYDYLTELWEDTSSTVCCILAQPQHEEEPRYHRWVATPYLELPHERLNFQPPPQGNQGDKESGYRRVRFKGHKVLVLALTKAPWCS